MEQLRERIPDDEAALACANFARAYAALFDQEPEPYVRYIDEIVRAFDAAGYQRYAALQRFHIPYACAALGDYDDGLRRCRDALAVCQRLELGIYANGAKSQLAWFLARAGELEAGTRLATEALDYCVAVGQKLMEGNVRCRLAAIYKMAGDLDASEHHARTAVNLKGLAPTFRGDASIRLSAVLLAKGQHGEALEVSRQAMKMTFPSGNHFGSHGLAWLNHIDVLAANGQRDESNQTLRDAQAWLRDRAARIVDPRLRALFTGAVPEHAEILGRP
jgi:tetratricopeptide (TPR) repeat protein